MAELIDRMELTQHQRVELYEEGVTQIMQVWVPGGLRVTLRTMQARL